MLSWDHLHYFTLVAEKGSVAAAARAIGVSHATILRAIKRLEATLDLRLFDHLKTGYRLTPEGTDLLSHATRMAAEASAIERRAQGQGEVPRGELGISLPDTTIVDLMPMLAAFRSEFPDVTINLKPGTPETPGTMLDQDIRIAFLLTSDPPDDLVGRRLDTISFAPAALLASKDNDAWITWLGSERYFDPQTVTRVRGSQAGSRADTIVRSHADALGAVREGMGAAMIATSRIAPPLTVASDRSRVEVGLWMLTHPEFRADSRVRAMMAFAPGWDIGANDDQERGGR